MSYSEHFNYNNCTQNTNYTDQANICTVSYTNDHNNTCSTSHENYADACAVSHYNYGNACAVTYGDYAAMCSTSHYNYADSCSTSYSNTLGGCSTSHFNWYDTYEDWTDGTQTCGIQHENTHSNYADSCTVSHYNYADSCSVTHSNYANACQTYYTNSHANTCSTSYTNSHNNTCSTSHYNYGNACAVSYNNLINDCTTHTNYSNHINYSNPDSRNTIALNWDPHFSGNAMVASYFQNSIQALERVRDNINYLNTKKGTQSLSNIPFENPLPSSFNDNNSLTIEEVSAIQFNALRNNLDNLFQTLTGQGSGTNIVQNDVAFKTQVENLKVKTDELAAKTPAQIITTYANVVNYQDATHTNHTNTVNN